MDRQRTDWRQIKRFIETLQKQIEKAEYTQQIITAEYFNRLILRSKNEKTVESLEKKEKWELTKLIKLYEGNSLSITNGFYCHKVMYKYTCVQGTTIKSITYNITVKTGYTQNKKWLSKKKGRALN